MTGRRTQPQQSRPEPTRTPWPVKPVPNQIYVPNIISNNVTVLAQQEVQDIPLRASTTPLADNQTTTSTLTVTFTTASTFSPIAPPVESC